MALLLWILAVILVVSGIVSLIRGQMLWGIVLIIVGRRAAPGGVSLYTSQPRRDTADGPALGTGPSLLYAVADAGRAASNCPP